MVTIQTDNEDNEDNKFKTLLITTLNMARKLNKKRIIIFNRRVEKSMKNLSSIEDFKGLANEKCMDNVHLYGISGKTDKTINYTCFEEFNKKDEIIKIISNVGILREGTNLPLADMIVYCEAKHSTTLITQNIGRVLRRKDDNSNSVIMIPIYCTKTSETQTENVKSLISKQKFSILIQLVKVLREIDER